MPAPCYNDRELKDSNKNNMKEIKHTATLTIYGLPKMNGKKLAKLIKWLEQIAKDLETIPSHSTDGFKNYAKRYTARLMK